MKILKKLLIVVIFFMCIFNVGYCEKVVISTNEENSRFESDSYTVDKVNAYFNKYTDESSRFESSLSGEDAASRMERVTQQLNNKYGEGNWRVDPSSLAQIGICDNDAELILLDIQLITTSTSSSSSTSVSGSRQELVSETCNYSSGSDSSESHFKVELHPNRENYLGKENLYMLGDEINLTGNNCVLVVSYYDECVQHTLTYDVYEEFEEWDTEKEVIKYIDENGVEQTEIYYDDVLVRKWEECVGSYSTSGPGCGDTIHTGTTSSNYPVSIKFDGFKVDNGVSGGNIGGSFNFSDNTSITNSVWDTGKMKITEINNVYYDKAKGAFYGKIIVSSGCSKRCKKEFILYFGNRGEASKIVDLTVKVTPNSGGTAKITGIIDQNNNGKIDVVEKEAKTISITNEKTLNLVAGNVYKIQAIDGNGHKYSYILTPDGNIITNKNPYDYTMPPVSAKLIVHFTPTKDEGHTLYVSSNEGGKAWTETRPTGTTYESISTTLGSSKIKVDKIIGVKAGTEFELKYEAEEGYEFDRWEYRPFINEDSFEGNITKITMPNSDLTATAIFKKKAVIPEDRDPILKVTSNNEEWGTAYAIVNGNKVSISEVVPGTEYVIVFEAKEGYYFTNWDYDSTISPFKDAQNGIIVMPKYDVEITAFFAPIPTQDGPSRAGDVKFVAETTTPEDGIIPGTVPENLLNIASGAEVTFGVTANIGYEFAYWYFTDINGNIITPDNNYTEYGSGKFIMPDYDIIAHAVFKKVEYSNLEVRIEGEGAITSDDKDIPNGSIITVTKGEYVELVATPNDGSKFLYWTDEEGNILSYDETIHYKVDEDKVIIAWFEKKEAYTLYITSMEGGNAWTKGNENHPESSIITTTDALEKTVYKIENVYEGEKFKIYYNAEIGYLFDKWEYKPYIIPERDNREKTNGTIEILMPASDLTVTAVFKNDEVVLEPELRVTSNNKEWGSAYTIINGKETKMDKTYKVVVGEEYTVYYEAKPGYYFVNWNYSTSRSPFVEENKVKMPNKNLEVMAFFSPIPEPPTHPTLPDLPTPPTKSEKHSIDFVASPPEGGSVPEDLVDEIVAGSKVTIGVTPNSGWEFDYWYFENAIGEIIEVEVHFDPDGSGYFIMPDEDVKAIAVFKKIKGYTLYVVYTEGGKAWAMDDNIQSVRIEEAIPESIYELDYEVEPGYKFVGWEFRWDNYGTSNGIRADIYKDENKVLMPYSDLTVTAKFEKEEHNGPYKLRVISNNYLWGNAWIDIDGTIYCWREVINGVTQQNPNDEPGISLEAGKDYKIYYKAEAEFIYTNCLPETWITLWPTNDDEGYLIINIPKDYLKSDVELTVYFKPGEKADKLYDLTVRTNPLGAGIVSGAENGIKENDIFTVNVKEVNPGYKFEYWYYEVDGKKVIVTNNKMYKGQMPGRDLELIAYFVESDVQEDSDPKDNPKKPDDKVYHITVKIEGKGNVTDTNGNTITVKKMKDGESIILVAKPDDNYIFVGWMIDGKIVSISAKEKFTIDGESITVTACFIKKQVSIADEFKIISVRDLRWKDYFIEGSSLTGNVFNIPKENTTMLQKVNEYPDVLKMGYAVEFELTTSQLNPEKAVLVIEPTIINNKTGKVVAWKDIKDNLTRDNINLDFSKIVIYGNGDGNKYTKMYQTSVKPDSSYRNNGVSINKLTWNWLYYLPADIYFANYGDDITIRFNIELHETSDGKTYSNSTLKEKLVLFEQTYNGVKWNGDVFKYSMKQSLLDDIYDNAQN